MENQNEVSVSLKTGKTKKFAIDKTADQIKNITIVARRLKPSGESKKSVSTINLYYAIREGLFTFIVGSAVFKSSSLKTILSEADSYVAKLYMKQQSLMVHFTCEYIVQHYIEFEPTKAELLNPQNWTSDEYQKNYKRLLAMYKNQNKKAN